jgi:hypothetical protein
MTETLVAVRFSTWLLLACERDYGARRAEPPGPKSGIGLEALLTTRALSNATMTLEASSVCMCVRVRAASDQKTLGTAVT